MTEIDTATDPLIVVAATGVELIAAERQRQIGDEGWTPEHDAEHSRDELVAAAASYLRPPRHRHPTARSRTLSGPWPVWPWQREHWKPSPNDRVRELVKAGALIAAEIDRLNAIARELSRG